MTKEPQENEGNLLIVEAVCQPPSKNIFKVNRGQNNLSIYLDRELDR